MTLVRILLPHPGRVVGEKPRPRRVIAKFPVEP